MKEEHECEIQTETTYVYKWGEEWCLIIHETEAVPINYCPFCGMKLE